MFLSYLKKMCSEVLFKKRNKCQMDKNNKFKINFPKTDYFTMLKFFKNVYIYIIFIEIQENVSCFNDVYIFILKGRLF